MIHFLILPVLGKGWSKICLSDMTFYHMQVTLYSGYVTSDGPDG